MKQACRIQPQKEENMEQQYRVKHPTLGYLEKIERTQWETARFYETWTKNTTEAMICSREKLNQPMDANGYGLMKILVSGYTGLSLEEV